MEKKYYKINQSDAISAHCAECMGARDGVRVIEDIRQCTAPNCPLFSHRPYQKEEEWKGYVPIERFSTVRGVDIGMKKAILEFGEVSELELIAKKEEQIKKGVANAQKNPHSYSKKKSV